ncbi:hypothetical protein GDO86_015298 [Hymenochirus boettgeri]|uniref:Uncharacterized protein n=1 Tax=Hymenochirus boettgeri TaxID=247094 RepID=A0A8T2JSD4_9PIPI|nr:hypothetical protein GDO86_015298 [Hymenochirus boettgeri]
MQGPRLPHSLVRSLPCLTLGSARRSLTLSHSPGEVLISPQATPRGCPGGSLSGDVGFPLVPMKVRWLFYFSHRPPSPCL